MSILYCWLFSKNSIKTYGDVTKCGKFLFVLNIQSTYLEAQYFLHMYQNRTISHQISIVNIDKRVYVRLVY